jgi:hypothetical protein
MIDQNKEVWTITKEFLESSERLLKAASLTDSDPIKQEMISFTRPDFDKMMARSEAMKILLNEDFQNNKNFILSEMVEITKLSLEIAKKIEDKLLCLAQN